MSTDDKPSFDPEEIAAPEALRELLRNAHEADQLSVEVPEALDRQIVNDAVARLASKRKSRAVQSAQISSAKLEELPANVVRVAFGRRLMWLAGAGVILLGAGWWFRHWSGAPLDPSAGQTAIVLRPAEPEPNASLPDAGSISNALRLAAESRSADRPGESIEYYGQVLKRDSRHVLALLEQGALLLDAFNLPRAEERFNQLLAIQSTNAEARYLRAVVWTHEGRFRDAALALAELLADRPNDSRLLLAQARAMELQGRIDEALILQRRNLLQNPGDQAAQTAFRDFFESFGPGPDLPTELVVLAASEVDPAKQTALKLFAVNELARGTKLSDAAVLVGEVLVQDPGNTGARFLQSRLFVHQQRFDEAETILRDLLLLPNPDPSWRLELAHVLHHRERTAEFWQELATVSRLPGAASPTRNFEYATHRKVRNTTDPDFARIDQLFREVFSQGTQRDNGLTLEYVTWLRRAGAVDTARQVLETAFAQGDGALLRLARAELLNTTGNYRRGQEEADVALRYNPGLARAWWARGFAFEGRGQWGEAAASYYRALLHDPLLTTAGHGLLRARDKQKTPRRSADDFADLIKRRPSGRVNYALWRAHAFARGGLPARALDEIENASEFVPGDLRVLAAKADTLAGLGRYDQARDVARTVVARVPNHRVSNMTLGKIAVDFGDLSEAEAALRRLEEGDYPYESSFLRGMIDLNSGRYQDSVLSLTRALSHAPNESDGWEFRALAGLLGGDFATAIRDYQALVQRFGTNDHRANQWLVDEYLAFRGAGRPREAATMLRGALAQGDSCRWPYPMLRVFAGELPPEVVIAQSQEVALDALKKTDFWPHRAFGHEVSTRIRLGQFAEAEGDFDSARRHYAWVVEHRDPMWLEYLAMATNRLQALEGRVSRGKLSSIDDRHEPRSNGLHDGLLVWLPLDRDLNDHGPAGLSVGIRGNVRMENGGARFPGDGHYLELPHVSMRQREFSISFWMKYEGTADHFSLFSQKESDDCDRAMYLQLVKGDLLRFGFFNDDVVSPLPLPSREQWNHVVFQYSRYRQSIWLNGRQLVERVSAPYEAAAGNCRIGAMPTEWTGHHEFAGGMRDFRIYGRALRQEEIHQLAGITPVETVASVESGLPVVPATIRGSAQASPAANTSPNPEALPFLQIQGNQLTVSAPPVQVYELQFTPDLNLDWAPLATITNSTGRVEFVDEGALKEGARFYRVKVTSSRPQAQGAGD